MRPPRFFLSLEEVVTNSTNVLTVGSFDGLHAGHRAILEELRRQAASRAANAVVITFEPHPQLVLERPEQPPIQILTTIEEKFALLEALGISHVIVIPFTRAFSQTPSDLFVREILHQKIGMQAIVIGHDHGFGKNREGDVATLMRLGQELKFDVHEVPPFVMEGKTISSTLIRHALVEGDIVNANGWLSYAYGFMGRVVKGAGRGKIIGFPTANLEPVNPHKLMPGNGVYAVKVKLSGSEHSGMMNIGTRPTFEGSPRTLEVHLFDFSQNIYDERCEVRFIARLRAERKFDSVEALQEQLQRDKKMSLQALAARL